MTVTSQYVGGGAARPVAQSESKTVMSFLAQPGHACTEAWVLAQATSNSDGPLRVRLVSHTGQPLSDEAQVFGANVPQRTRFQNVQVPASTFPPVVKVVATNSSTVGDDDAVVEGVLLVYS